MTEAYKIGVTVVLKNLIGSELTMIAKQFAAADASALGFAGRLGMVAAAAAVVTGALIVTTNEARKFQTEAAKFELFGMGSSTNRNAQAFAENMKVIGTSATEAMRLMNEAQGVFRESGLDDEQALRGAKLAAPMLAKIDFVSKSLDSAGAASMHHSAQAMLRFIDMQGGINSAERFNDIANAGFKAIRSSGGNIDWEQYRQFRARGASAAANLSDEALFGHFEPIIQELKGSTAGFSLRTAYNRLNGIIRLPNQAAHALVDIGAWDPAMVQWNAMGGIKQFRGNPLRDADLFARDPVTYYEKYILPYYNQKGLSPEERVRTNAMIFGSTGGNLFSLIERQLPAIHHSADAWRKAKGIDEAVDVARKTVDGKMVEVTAQWETLMKNIGTELLPAVNVGLQALAGILKGINDVFSDPFWGPVIKGIATGNPAGGLASGVVGWGRGLFGGSGAAPSASGGQTVTIVNKTFLDSKVVAESTANHFLGGFSKMPATGNDYDLRASPLMPGYSPFAPG